MNNWHLGKVAPNCAAEDMADVIVITLYPPDDSDKSSIASITVLRETDGAPEPKGIGRCLT